MPTVRPPEYDLYCDRPIIRIFTGRTFKDKETKQDKEEFIAMGYRKAVAIRDQWGELLRFIDLVETKRLEPDSNRGYTR
jgi:hypothetical protein